MSKVPHKKNRVTLSVDCGAYECVYCELNIAESNWRRVCNGADRSFVGIGKYEGEKFRTEWLFDDRHVFITGEFGGGSYFDGSIDEICSDCEDLKGK